MVTLYVSWEKMGRLSFVADTIIVTTLFGQSDAGGLTSHAVIRTVIIGSGIGVS